MDPAAYPADCERAVVAAVILDPARLADITRLRPDHFAGDLTSRVYTGILSLTAAGQPIEIIALARHLGLDNRDKVALSAMLDGVVKSSSVAWYAQQVVRGAWRRKIGSIAGRIHESAANGLSDDIIAEMIAELADAPPDMAARILASEPLSAVLARPIPETPWAVEGFLCLGDIALLAGAGGTGKSWISLYVALCMADGRPLWDYLPCIRPYRVAVVDLESRPWEIDQRLHRLALGMRVDPTDTADRIDIVRERIRLDIPEHLESLIQSVRKWGSEVLIIDSMRRTFLGSENESDTSNSLFLNALDPLRAETGAAIVLIDHYRKKSADETLNEPDQRVRGSGDKFALADLVVGTERRDEEIVIHPTKGRHRGTPLLPFLVHFTGFEADADPKGPVAASYVGPLDTASDASQDSILVILQDGEWHQRGEIIGRSGMSARTVDGALAALLARGKTERMRDGHKAMYRVKSA